MIATAPVSAQTQEAPHVQVEGPVTLDAPDLLQNLVVVRDFTEVGLSASFEVEGERFFDGRVLAAETIIFQPGSRLVLAGERGDRENRYIVARTIKILNGTPPVVTWVRPSSNDEVPPVSGAAPSGSIGGGEGSEGTPGATGQTGNPGFPGRSGPTVFLIVGRVEGGPLHIDIRGQSGGRGGEGQRGGEGGPGRAGRPGVSSIIDCRSGGQNGGPGGRGGDGGKGGPGGRGGNGGTLIVMSTEASLRRIQTVLQADVGGGDGGPGGPGGKPGPGGPGGLGGSGSGLCQGGQMGSAGLQGAAGFDGDGGPPGTRGLFGQAVLTEQQLARVIGGR
jgi:hypothetical protein